MLADCPQWVHSFPQIIVNRTSIFHQTTLCTPGYGNVTILPLPRHPKQGTGPFTCVTIRHLDIRVRRKRRPSAAAPQSLYIYILYSLLPLLLQLSIRGCAPLLTRLCFGHLVVHKLNPRFCDKVLRCVGPRMTSVISCPSESRCSKYRTYVA